jgi:outer membrane protein assembly factor BamE (lipoprotein component of BamABCDE complex)
MTSKSLWIAMVLSLGLSACSLFPMNGEMESMGMRSDLFDEAPPSRNSRTYVSSNRGALESRSELRDLEENLRPGMERRQYDNARSALGTDAERIEFLRLPNYEARERFLANRAQVSGNSYRSAPRAAVRLGMNRKLVSEILGDPDQVEHAGNPVYGNERWVYQEETSSDRGFNTRRRVIYFESGRVVGWQTL